MAGQPSAPCIFCQIASKSTSTALLHSDEKVVAFQDISPAAVRHYLVIPLEHIPTVKDLQRRTEDFSLVNHMLEVGQMLLRRDAPDSPQHRFGFHQPPLNSINHLHLHCLALPYTPGWKRIKFLSLGSLGFLEAEKLLERLKPLPPVISKACSNQVWQRRNLGPYYKLQCASKSFTNLEKCLMPMLPWPQDKIPLCSLKMIGK